MPTIRRDLEALARLSDDDLATLFAAGRAPEPDALAGWELRGWAPSLAARLLGQRKFRLGFFRPAPDAAAADLRGYVVPAVQDGLRVSWRNRHGEATPRRSTWLNALPADADDTPPALRLDFKVKENRVWRPVRWLCASVVQVDADNPDLYLGKAAPAAGPLQVGSWYFVLERLQETDFTG